MKINFAICPYCRGSQFLQFEMEDKKQIHCNNEKCGRIFQLLIFSEGAVCAPMEVTDEEVKVWLETAIAFEQFDAKRLGALHPNCRSDLSSSIDELAEVPREVWDRFMPTSTVPELMADAAKTFKERNVLYGDSYKSFHTIARALFPGGLQIETEDEWKRFGVLFFAIGKMVRYCNNFKQGGHVDSAHDLGVYSFMLEEVTRMGQKENK